MADATAGTSGPTRDATTGALVGALGEQLSDLVRSEMELGRLELKETVKRAGTGAGLFGGAGVVALYGGGALVAAVVLALALLLPAWLAALLVGLVLLAVAGVMGLLGKKQVDQAAPPLQHSVASVQRDVDAVAHGTNRSQT